MDNLKVKKPRVKKVTLSSESVEPRVVSEPIDIKRKKTPKKRKANPWLAFLAKCRLDPKNKDLGVTELVKKCKSEYQALKNSSA